MRLVSVVIASVLVDAAAAAPPPPPPEYVWNARQILVGTHRGEEAAVAPMFADDVAAFQNGVPVAVGKPEWLRWRRSNRPPDGERVLGYSESWTDGGSLLVIETFDAVDRSDLPRNFIADPRIVTRTTLYQFASDRLIHAIRMFRVDGWLQRPDEPPAVPPGSGRSRP